MADWTTEAVRFMTDLYANNAKMWFDANRDRYEASLRDPIKRLASSMTGPVTLILPEFEGKPRISRINNDLRFHPDKPIYKEHMWISFEGVKGLTELFIAVGRRGWSVGATIGSPKREPLDPWRRNLIQYADRWERYAKAIGIGDGVELYLEGSYRRPLFPDVPETVAGLVQAKEVYVVTRPREEFQQAPEEYFFTWLANLLPAYLFMSVSGNALEERLGELGTFIDAPFPEVEGVWESVRE